MSEEGRPPPPSRGGFTSSKGSTNGGLTSTPSETNDLGSPKSRDDDVVEDPALQRGATFSAGTSQAPPGSPMRRAETGIPSSKAMPLSVRSQDSSSSSAFSTASSTAFHKNALCPTNSKGKRAIVDALARVDAKGLFSYVPTVLLQLLTSRPTLAFETLEFKAATCFIDVCGFTRITEEMRRSADGSNGIAEHLNRFFSLLLKIIEDCGGDVVQFSGDAILCIWRSDDGSLGKVAQRAFRCVLRIMEQTRDEVIQFTAQEAPIRLGVHSSMALGDVRFSVLGGFNDQWRYVTTGDAVKDAVNIVDLARMDEIALSPMAYEVIKSDATFVVDLKPVYGNRSNSTSTLSDGEQRMGSSAALAYKYSATAHPSLNRISTFSEVTSLADINAHPIRGHSGDEFAAESGRDISDLSSVSQETMKYKVYSFLFDTIINHWGKEGEIRTVSTIFIHILLGDGGVKESGLQTTIGCVQSELSSRDGVLNKVLFDDKGATLLCVFGLPGHANEGDAVNAVAFAYATACKLEGSGCTLAMGISRSKVYCGICGSNSRREYTVLGDGVNVAARVMQHAIKESHRRLAQAHDEDSTASIVCVDDTTKIICGSNFKFAGGEDVKLKGKSVGCKVWEVLEGNRGGVGGRRASKLQSGGNARDAMQSAMLAMKGGRNRLKRGRGNRASTDELAELDELDALSGANESDSSDKNSIHVYGREQQLSTAYEMLAHIQRTASTNAPLPSSHPSSRAMTIYGEAAMGKSILVRKIIDEAFAQNITVLSTSCSMLERDSPYYVLTMLMQPLARRPLSWLAVDIDVVDRELRPLLNTFMPNLNIMETETTMMLTEEERQDAVYDVVRGIFKREYEGQAVLMCIDDIHYADVVSLGAVTHVLRSSPNIAVVVSQRVDELGSTSAIRDPVSTANVARFEDDGTPVQGIFRDWGGQNAFERNGPTIQVHLPPLAKSDMSLLLRKVLKCHVEDQIVEIILRKAGGNPGFSEQLLVSLLDGVDDGTPVVIVDDNNIAKFADGVDVNNLQLPDGIEGIITGRVDKLQPRYQHYLKVAAVIGATFSLALLQRVMKETDLQALQEAMTKLENLGFVTQHKKSDFGEKPNRKSKSKRTVQRKQSVRSSASNANQSRPTAPGAVSYTFRLQLMKDVLYSMLLSKEKREFHSVVAEELERDVHAGAQLDPQALIHHFTSADLADRALRYLGTAADEALMKGSPASALRYASKALETDAALSDVHPYKVSKRQRFHWLALRSQSMYQVGALQDSYDEASKFIQLANEPAVQSSPCHLQVLGAYNSVKLWAKTRDRMKSFMERRRKMGANGTSLADGSLSSISDAHDMAASLPPQPPPPPPRSNPRREEDSSPPTTDDEGADEAPGPTPLARRQLTDTARYDPSKVSPADLLLAYHVLALVSYHINSVNMTRYYCTRGLVVSEQTESAYKGLTKGKRGCLCMLNELLGIGAVSDTQEVSMAMERSVARYPTDAAHIERMGVLACCNTGNVKTMDFYLARHRNVVDDIDFATTAMVHLSASCSRALCSRPEDANKRLLACAKVAHSKSDKRIESYSVLLSIYVDLVICGGEARRSQANAKLSRAIGLINQEKGSGNTLGDDVSQPDSPDEEARLTSGMHSGDIYRVTRKATAIFTDRLLFFVTQAITCLISQYVDSVGDTLTKMQRAYIAMEEIEGTPHNMIKLIALHALLEVSLSQGVITFLKDDRLREHAKRVKRALALMKSLSKTVAPARPLYKLLQSLCAIRIDGVKSSQSPLVAAHEEATMLHMPFVAARSKTVLAAEFMSPGRMKEVLAQVRDLFFRAGTTEELQQTYGVPSVSA